MLFFLHGRVRTLLAQCLQLNCVCCQAALPASMFLGIADRPHCLAGAPVGSPAWLNVSRPAVPRLCRLSVCMPVWLAGR